MLADGPADTGLDPLQGHNGHGAGVVEVADGPADTALELLQGHNGHGAGVVEVADGPADNSLNVKTTADVYSSRLPISVSFPAWYTY